MNLLDLFFPPRCLGCRTFLDDSEPLCEACDRSWPSLGPSFCGQGGIFCRRIYVTGLYEGLLLEWVHRMKYRREERLANYLGRRMAEAIPSDGYDLILPIPLHRARLRERGFNQALLLAREVGKGFGKVDPFLLAKTSPTAPQTLLKGEERRKNLRGAFCLRKPEKVEGKKILLVDDVYTTGTTVETAARELLRGGADHVDALVLARVS